MKTILIHLVIVQVVVFSSCCLKCRECKLTLKYAWKNPVTTVCIINMHNDSLILSEIYFKSEPNKLGNTQHVYDDKNYVLNKENGLVTSILVKLMLI